MGREYISCFTREETGSGTAFANGLTIFLKTCSATIGRERAARPRAREGGRHRQGDSDEMVCGGRGGVEHGVQVEEGGVEQRRFKGVK